MYNLKLGILIIGSLLWETKKYGREGWRHERLNVQAKQKVDTHTRYARISQSRGWTHTMVFSASAKPSTAIVVPCLSPAKSPGNIFEEARRLALAENLDGDDKWKDFGAVGALANPQSERASQALLEWPEYFRRHLNDGCEATSLSGPGETPSITEDGFLNVQWPRCHDLGLPNDCDILLATANAPTLNDNGSYPTADQIAQRYLDAGQADYFKNNVLNEIITADDVAIWRHIKAAQPAWIANDEYERISTILETDSETTGR